jgi:hypothetical protein
MEKCGNINWWKIVYQIQENGNSHQINQIRNNGKRIFCNNIQKNRRTLNIFYEIYVCILYCVILMTGKTDLKNKENIID